MKGAMMKLGQMVSYLDQGMPDHVREALAELQSNATPMSAELAAQVIREELGADTTDVFGAWETEPKAAASIRWVQRAITHNGGAGEGRVTNQGEGEGGRANTA